CELVADGGAGEPAGDRLGEAEQQHGDTAADDATFEAKPEEVPQEVVGDVAIAGTDEMQDFDDRAVGCHGAAGRKRNRYDGRDDDKRENADAGEYGGVGHRAHTFDPGAVIVD